MTSVVELYEQLSSAPDDKTRARLIAEAFERMEERYPEVRDLATHSALTETALQLKKEIVEAEGRVKLEIEQLRTEQRETEGRLTKEIEQLRGEQRETEGRLTKEIEQLRSEVRRDIAEVRSSTLRWVVGLLTGQTLVIITALFAIAWGQ